MKTANAESSKASLLNLNLIFSNTQYIMLERPHNMIIKNGNVTISLRNETKLSIPYLSLVKMIGMAKRIYVGKRHIFKNSRDLCTTLVKYINRNNMRVGSSESESSPEFTILIACCLFWFAFSVKNPLHDLYLINFLNSEIGIKNTTTVYRICKQSFKGNIDDNLMSIFMSAVALHFE